MKFPQCNKNLIDKNLEINMNLIQNIVSIIHSLRKNNNLKIRQPLKKISIFSNTNIENILNFKDIILAETNVKNIEILNDSSSIFEYKIKPNFKILGKKYGNKMKEISDEINNFNKQQIDELIKNKEITLKNGIKIIEDEYILETIPKENICVEKFDNIIIGLDTIITEDLKEEGIAREFINIIQTYRKNNNYNIDDVTNINFYCENKEITNSILKYKDMICKTILCENLINSDKNNTFNFETDINEFNIKLTLKVTICLFLFYFH